MPTVELSDGGKINDRKTLLEMKLSGPEVERPQKDEAFNREKTTLSASLSSEL